MKIEDKISRLLGECTSTSNVAQKEEKMGLFGTRRKSKKTNKKKSS